MSELKRFSHATKDVLRDYVYLLIDPRDGAIFYVGKASANDRPFAHLADVRGEGEKFERIAAIRAADMEPLVHVLRFGLDAGLRMNLAEEIEAAVIDTLGLENLTNGCRGKGIERGRVSAKELERRFNGREVKVSTLHEPYMPIWINKTYSPTMNTQELYDTTRQFWHRVGLAKRTLNADGVLPYPTVLAIVENTVVMAYQVHAWLPAGATWSTRLWHGTDKQNKWEFVGRPLEDHRLIGWRLVDDAGEPLRANQQGYSYIN